MKNGDISGREKLVIIIRLNPELDQLSVVPALQAGHQGWFYLYLLHFASCPGPVWGMIKRIIYCNCLTFSSRENRDATLLDPS